MPHVELTRHLYQFFPQLEAKRIEVDGATVAEVVGAIEKLAPGFSFYICDERGALRTHVNLFVGDEPVVDRRTLSDKLPQGARVTIMQALSGG